VGTRSDTFPCLLVSQLTTAREFQGRCQGSEGEYVTSRDPTSEKRSFLVMGLGPFSFYARCLLSHVDLPALLGYNLLTIGGHGCTVGIDFEWDPNKAARNLRKHSVAFEEAATVFRDDLSITVPDPDHSTEEERFITVGLSSQDRLLIIAHAERSDRIRIISARELTPRERRQYEEADWNG